MTPEEAKALVDKQARHQYWSHHDEEACTLCYREVLQIAQARIEALKGGIKHLAEGDWANPDDPEWKDEGSDFDHGFNAATHAARRLAKALLEPNHE